MAHKHKHKKQAGCQHVVTGWQFTRRNPNNIRHTEGHIFSTVTNAMSITIPGETKNIRIFFPCKITVSCSLITS